MATKNDTLKMEKRRCSKLGIPEKFRLLVVGNFLSFRKKKNIGLGDVRCSAGPRIEGAVCFCWVFYAHLTTNFINPGFFQVGKIPPSPWLSNCHHQTRRFFAEPLKGSVFAIRQVPQPVATSTF